MSFWEMVMKKLWLWIRKAFQWVKKACKKVWNILYSNLYLRIFNKNEYIFRKRYDICSQCNNRKRVPVIGEVCGLCGCILQAKLRCPDEECVIEKWKSVK